MDAATAPPSIGVRRVRNATEAHAILQGRPAVWSSARRVRRASPLFRRAIRPTRGPRVACAIAATARAAETMKALGTIRSAIGPQHTRTPKSAAVADDQNRTVAIEVAWRACHTAKRVAWKKSAAEASAVTSDPCPSMAGKRRTARRSTARRPGRMAPDAAEVRRWSGRPISMAWSDRASARRASDGEGAAGGGPPDRDGSDGSRSKSDACTSNCCDALCGVRSSALPTRHTKSP